MAPPQPAQVGTACIARPWRRSRGADVHSRGPGLSLGCSSFAEGELRLKAPCLLISPLGSHPHCPLSSHTCLTHLGTGLLPPLPPPSRALCLAPGRRSHQVWKQQDLDVRKKHATRLCCGASEFRSRVNKQDRQEGPREQESHMRVGADAASGQRAAL